MCKLRSANSSEHKHKKEILKSASFNGKKGDKPYHLILNGDGGSIQGPDSKSMKYKDVLCTVCNNELSQPWDKAYGMLLTFFIKQAITEISFINFKDIFGLNFKDELGNLHKYFIKSLGCAIINSNSELADDFPDPLNEKYLQKLKITICKTHVCRHFLNRCINKAYPIPNGKFHGFNASTADVKNILGKGPLLANYSKSHFDATGKKKIIEVLWWESIGEFQITYWFNLESLPEFGGVLHDSKKLYTLLEYAIDVDFDKMEQKMKSIIFEK